MHQRVTVVILCVYVSVAKLAAIYLVCESKIGYHCHHQRFTSELSEEGDSGDQPQ